MVQLDASVPQKLLKVRRLEAGDAAVYRELRLEGLSDQPEAFGASWEDESVKPASWWTERLEANTVFGGWIDSSPLLGVAGFHVNGAAKLRHKGILWGMYVRPDARGTGLAASLARQIIAYTQPLGGELGLAVVTSDAHSRRLLSR